MDYEVAFCGMCSSFRLKRIDNDYYRVQGQLNALKRCFRNFVSFFEDGLHTDRIYRNIKCFIKWNHFIWNMYFQKCKWWDYTWNVCTLYYWFSIVCTFCVIVTTGRISLYNYWTHKESYSNIVVMLYKMFYILFSMRMFQGHHEKSWRMKSAETYVVPLYRKLKVFINDAKYNFWMYIVKAIEPGVPVCTTYRLCKLKAVTKLYLLSV